MAIFGSNRSEEEEKRQTIVSQIKPPGNLMVEHKDIKSEEFDVAIIKWMDGSRSQFNKMIIHPIELGNVLEFRNKSDNNFSGKRFKMHNVVGVNKQIRTKEGFLSKKENIVLEILLSNLDSSMPHQSIIVDVEDKHAQSIIDAIEKTRHFNQDEEWKSLSFPVLMEDNSIQNIDLFAAIPFFAPGEQLLWSDINTEGIITTHVVFLNALTNYRVLQYDFKSHLSNYATMGAIDDVLVTNQRRISQSSGSGAYTGLRSGYTRTFVGNTSRRSTGITVGDVVFIHEGKPALSFSQIKDPNGLARLAKSARKQFTLVEKAMKKMQKSGKSENRKSVTCVKCGVSNAEGSNFCNSCGNELS